MTDSAPLLALADAARQQADDLVTLRRELHTDPEVGLQLPRTQARVVDALEGLPLELSFGRSLTSVVAVLRGTADDMQAMNYAADAQHEDIAVVARRFLESTSGRPKPAAYR